MDLIEDKLERMCRELEHIQKENYNMKSNEERIKNQFNNLERKYIKKTEKFNNLKENYDILLTKLREFENIVIR
jgi:archaellum component FlaC